MELAFEFEGPGLDAIVNIARSNREIAKQTVIVNNRTAKTHVKQISKSIREHIAVTNKGVKKVVKVQSFARLGNASARILIKNNGRPSLKEFKARQTKSGVSYKISKKAGRRKVRSAFISNRLGGHAYKRKGKARLPIAKLLGVSVAAVYAKHRLIKRSVKQIQDRQQFEADRRLRALVVSSIRRTGRKEGKSTDQINADIKRQLG